MAAPRLETQWLDLPIGRMRVRTVGSGAPILLTHGLLVDGRIWDQVALAVAERGCAVVIPDLPLGSHTVAVADRQGLTTAAVAGALLDVADRLGVDRVSLLGFDTGGALAQVAAASHPDRIERLALMSCDAFEHFPPPMIKPFQWAARWSPAMTLVLKSLADPRLQHRPLPLGLVAKRKIDPALVAAWAAPAATDPDVRADLVAFLAQMSPADTLDAADHLRTYRGRSMVMWSRGDQVFPKGDATRLADLLPACQLRWIDDSYTFASLDNPARVIDLVLEWMAL